MDFKSCFTKTNIYFFLLILFCVFVLVKMTDIALLVFCGYIIFAAINPVVNAMSKKIPRLWASIIMIAVIGLVVLGIFIPIIILSVHEIKGLASQLPSQLENLQAFLKTIQIGDQSLNEILSIKQTWGTSSEIAGDVIEKSINITIGFIGLLTILVTMGIMVFFFTNDRDKIKDFSIKLFPANLKNRASEVIDDLELKVGGYVAAQVLAITIVGVLVAIGLSILHVNYAVLLGFVAAVSDLIPIVGPFICGFLILFAAFPNGWVTAVLAIFVLLLAQFVQNNWAKPYFFSKYMDLHPLVVIFSFILAAKFLGVVGVIVAPAIAAVVVTLFDEIYVKNMNCEDESK